MKMTTGTGIYCPHCSKELQFETKGLLGGIIKQFFLQAVAGRIHKEGAKIKCGNCGKSFYHYTKKRPSGDADG